MNVHDLIKNGASPEELEENLLDLDSEFRFKCRRCGKCCKNQDTIIFNTRDIFNIAHKLGRTMLDVIKDTSEVYIGHDSRLPIVHMVPHGPKNACPLLVDGRCSVHDCKPTVCALYPLGRMVILDRDLPMEEQLKTMKVRYIINDIDCGSAKRVNTVREWLSRFGIAEHDAFFIRWNQITIHAGQTIREMEHDSRPPQLIAAVWETIFRWLYVEYNTEADFMPQFLASADKLDRLLHDIRDITSMEDWEAQYGKTGT